MPRTASAAARRMRGRSGSCRRRPGCRRAAGAATPRPPPLDRGRGHHHADDARRRQRGDERLERPGPGCAAPASAATRLVRESNTAQWFPPWSRRCTIAPPMRPSPIIELHVACLPLPRAIDERRFPLFRLQGLRSLGPRRHGDTELTLIESQKPLDRVGPFMPGTPLPTVASDRLRCYCELQRSARAAGRRLRRCVRRAAPRRVAAASCSLTCSVAPRSARKRYVRADPATVPEPQSRSWRRCGRPYRPCC